MLDLANGREQVRHADGVRGSFLHFPRNPVPLDVGPNHKGPSRASHSPGPTPCKHTWPRRHTPINLDNSQGLIIIHSFYLIGTTQLAMNKKARCHVKLNVPTVPSSSIFFSSSPFQYLVVLRKKKCPSYFVVFLTHYFGVRFMLPRLWTDIVQFLFCLVG